MQYRCPPYAENPFSIAFPPQKLLRSPQISLYSALVLAQSPLGTFPSQIRRTIRSPEGPGLELQHPEVALLRQAAVVKGITWAAPAHVQRLVQPQAEVSTDHEGKKNQNEELEGF